MTETIGDIDVTLVPRIYGASELGVLSLTAPGASHPRVEYVGGDLFVGLDDARDHAALTQGQADALGRPFTEALAASLPDAAGPADAVDGALVIDDEAVAAAVLLEPARLPAAGLSGAPVVFALSRQRVVVVGSDDEDAVGRVLDLADELFEAGGPLVSAHPIVRADEGWAPFPWRERFPSLELRFERILRLFSVRAYDVQTAALQRPDVHIAEAKIQVLESGVTATYAAWPKGTATLLPVVDNVIIADPSGQLSVATLTQFLDAAGDAVVRTGLSPARYFVPGDQPRTSEA
ncbi:hypothetical protein AB3M83_12265 [Microbacterium sp. 179-B 1A2 NHS]|uniref:hypothetical protein n=1 Tax=Microbacterium sp. 179-B 1A2 NHS TaxID=3142383 RepID=UPI0039A135DE